MKNIWLILVLLLSFSTLRANHLLGGSVTWEANTGGTYTFTLVLYRDCTGNTYNQNTETILSNSPAGTIICYRTGINYLNRDCATTDCNTVAGTYQGAVEEHIFVSQPVVLTGAPPATGWIFRWDDCCRPSNLTNLNTSINQGVGIYAAMYPFTSGTTKLPAESAYNSSPVFLTEPNLSVCTGAASAVHYTGLDRDADSLHYAWVSAKEDGFGFYFPSVVYAAGYTFNQPFGPGNTANLDALTGRAWLNLATQGAYVTAVNIQEWRCGQLLAEYHRELPVFSKPCLSPSGLCSGTGNNAPALTLSYPAGADTLTPVYDANNALRYYEMTVAPNTNVSITFQASDTDLQPNCSAQSISFSGQSPFLYQAPTYDSLCSLGTGCADISSNNTNGAFTSALTNSVTFTWSAPCNPGGGVPQWCTGANEVYPFYFAFTDNACYYPKTTSFLVYINIGNTGSKPQIVSSDAILCPSDSATLSALGNHTTYMWSTGDTTAAIKAVPGTYWLRAGDTNACFTVDTFTLPALLPYITQPELCRVTYDYYTGHNKLVWERDQKSRVSRYIIYREEQGTAVPIGSKNVNALSEFVDSTSQYNVAYSYYLGIADSCGEVYQAVDKKHRTMLLSGQRITSDLHLNWNHYLGQTVHKYYIYRAFGLLGTFELLDSTTANYPAFVDVLQPVSGLVRYQVAALFDTTCTPSAKSADYLALSNIWSYSWFDLATYTVDDFALMPNPTQGEIYIAGPAGIDFTIYTSTGQAICIGKTGGEKIDVSAFPNGLYIVVLNVNRKPIHIKFTKTGAQ